MPKGFSEQEKEMIRRTLLEKGRALFTTYGLKKTSVDELTRATGISKGAFYLFYDSKEELFFDVIKQFEDEFRATIFDEQAGTDESATPQQRVKEVLQRALTTWREHPLFKHLNSADYEYVLRKIPAERAESHLRNDEAFVGQLIEYWKSKGIVIRSDPHVTTGLIRALFFVAMHQDDFDRDSFPLTFDILVELVAQHLVKAA